MFKSRKAASNAVWIIIVIVILLILLIIFIPSIFPEVGKALSQIIGTLKEKLFGFIEIASLNS